MPAKSKKLKDGRYTSDAIREYMQLNPGCYRREIRAAFPELDQHYIGSQMRIVAGDIFRNKLPPVLEVFDALGGSPTKVINRLVDFMEVRSVIGRHDPHELIRLLKSIREMSAMNK